MDSPDKIRLRWLDYARYNPKQCTRVVHIPQNPHTGNKKDTPCPHSARPEAYRKVNHLLSSADLPEAVTPVSDVVN